MFLKGGLPLALLAVVLVVTSFAHGALTPYASSTGAAAPTIRSDKDDYMPGETVTLTGANWQPGEVVHIFVNDDRGQTWSRNVDTAADESGNITDRFQLPDWFIATYSVTATGPVSGTATTSFTDGNVKVASAAGRHFDYQVTLYSSTNCTTGAGSPVTKTADTNGSTTGVGSQESLLVTANTNANPPNATATFSNWTLGSIVLASGYSATDRTICVVGFQSGNRDLIGNYAAAPANSPPAVARNNASVTVNEGQTATNTGTWSDANAGDTVTLTASVGTVTKAGSNASGTWSWSYATTDGTDNSQTVTITANDGNGGVSTTTFALTVNNVAPTVALSGDTSADEGQTKTYTFGVTDPGADTFGAAAGFPDCGTGGSFVTGSLTATTFQCSFPDGPATPTVRMRVTDSDGAPSNIATVPVAVANIAPSGTFANTGPVGEGSSFELSLTSVTDPSAPDTTAGFQYAFDCGDGSGYNAYGAANSRTCPTSDNGTRNVRAKVKDKDNGEREYTDSVAVNNVAPSITSVTNDGPVDEGSSATITVTAADVAGPNDPLAYEFDCNDDGTYEVGPQAGNSASCSFDDNGARRVNVRVSDGDGGAATGSTTVTVNNVDPAATFTNTAPVDEGTSFVLTLDNADDASAADKAAGFTFAFDCGDGGGYGAFSATPAQDGSRTCPTSDNGTRTVKGKIRDKDGGVTEYTDTVTINNAPPTITAVTNNGPIDEGSAATITVSATDPAGANDPLAYEFDCGNDGSFEIGPQAGSSAACSFADDGSYQVNVRVSDGDGGSDTDSTTVIVDNKPPVLTPPSDDNGVEGTSKSFGLGSFTDAGANDNPWQLHVTWGDGSAATDLTYNSRGALGMAPHAYDDNGVYTVTETITDKDGGSDTQTFEVTVANANPTATLGNDGPIGEGDSATVTFSAQHDPSGADTAAGFHYAFACDNGSLAGATYDGSGTSASHACAFADNGSYPVKGRIIDKDGGFSEHTTTVVVTNANPAVTAAADQAASEGAITAFDLGSFSDAGVNDNPWKVNVAWGDTKNDNLADRSSQGSLGSASHKYDDNGTYTVTVKVTDKDGGIGTATFKVTVGNVKPTITSFAGTGSISGPLVFAPSTFTGTFTDPGIVDNPWVVSWKWDGVSDPTTQNAGANGTTTHTFGPTTHTFASAGCSHTAEVKITDKDGAFDSASTTVEVGTGAFLPPMTNQPVTDKLKNGQVLPVKVEIKDCNGQPVTNLQPAIQLKKGDLTQGVADDSVVPIVPESVSSADTTGFMRLADSHYQYNLRVSVPAADLNVDYTVVIYPYGLANTSQTLRHVIRATK